MARTIKSSSNKLNCEIPAIIRDAITAKAKSEGHITTASYLNSLFGLYKAEPERFALPQKDIIRYVAMPQARFAWRVSSDYIKDFEWLATVNLRSLAGQGEYFMFSVYRNFCE